MQYSRARLTVILAVVIVGSYGQQPPSAPSRQRPPMECEHAAPPAGMHWVCSDPRNPCDCQLQSDRPGGGMLDSEGEQPATGSVSSSGFEQMMNTLAAARSEGNTAKFVDLFTQNPIGSNLTTGETYRGRTGAAKLFAGGKSSGQVATLEWHHLFFDEKGQVGAGEFTVEGNPHYHGVLILKLENGKIARWREYRLASNRSWERFTAENQF